MKRRTFLKASAISAVVAASGCYGAKLSRSRRRKPNILFLFSDQHKASVMGCAGHPLVRTPNLDRLANEGIRFTRAYCPDGICVPSRTSMFTGLYPRTTGVIYNSDTPPYPQRLHPLHSLLRTNGYVTGCFGKRHFPRGLNERDWDASCTTINPKLDPSDEDYWDWIRERGEYDSHNRDFKESHRVSLMAHISNTSSENRTTAYAADKSIEFLRRARWEDRPFFCWTSFIYPHQPYTPLERWARLYELDRIELPGNISEPVENLPERMRQWRTRTNPPWNCGTAAQNHAIYRRYVAYYYALVSEVDYHIGRLLSALRDLRLADDTVVIYSSDHGDFVAGHGMVEKCAVGHNVYEDTLQVPLICYDLPGRSLVPVLTGGTLSRKSYAISENWSQVTVIGERYKLGTWITPPEKYATWNWGKTHPGMLFDRQSDPLETNNLIDDPQMKSVREKLRRFLTQWEVLTPDDGKRQAVRSFNKT